MSKWEVRETDAYKELMKLFEDTSVTQSVTKARMLELRYEIDSLIAALIR